MRGTRPKHLRDRLGFASLYATPILLGSSSFAHSAPLTIGQMNGTAPVALAVGALGFSFVAAMLLRRARKRNSAITETAQSEIAQMRAELDLTQSVLEGLSELTLVWRDLNAAPLVYGQPATVGASPANRRTLGDFRTWLAPNDSASMHTLVSRLKNNGQAFDVDLVSLAGVPLRLYGRVIGGAAVVRVQPSADSDNIVQTNLPQNTGVDSFSAEAIFDQVNRPAWSRDQDGVLTYANSAYWALASAAGLKTDTDAIPDVLDAKTLAADMLALAETDGPLTLTDRQLAGQPADMVVFKTEAGSAGFIKNTQQAKPAPAEKSGDALASSAGIIDAISLPVAIFDGERRLKHFNSAYCSLWELDEDWLTSGVDETAILDKLRTQGQLPSEADYRAWRAKHLTAYKLTAPREEPWYLPDGRTLNVVAVPNTNAGGVIYVFENITEQLALESRYNALINVQSETLGALNEGVAVFGTNGRLTLSNPRLSTLWKLPMNELGQHPHIDQIAEFCAITMPDDGASIWADLKQNIVDLNPARTDRTGRVTRADGRMIDYSVTRLPDGQTMMTFVDVTEGANYQKILKERNDALVTADRMKDAFVQNVSYELRSPLTNIIGFADLLASGSAGELNEKQRSYTDYIRASSQTLGVLIDNILDLATADAGVAELQLEIQDIPALVDRARAGLIGTMTAGGNEAPPNLSVSVSDDLPEFVADGTRVVQMLYNLLSNAVRFSAPGAPVHLDIHARGSHVVFTVEDEGVGISDEMRAAVFQRFEGKSSQGRQRGAGLGLAIVKTFVNLHGGTISLERRDPKGTRVIVSIPANPAEAVSAAE